MIHTSISKKNVGLALSGGGVRAIAFHAGILKWLAERELLENICHISSVSGGSLFTGLVFQISGYRWPSSRQYLDNVLPEIRLLLTTKSLQFNAICRLLFNPLNWRFLLSRANVLAKSIESLWKISATLEKLPQHPVWSINATTAENGRRFRFKGIRIGDYEVGYAEAQGFRLSAAMAVSAAFPGGIGPLRLNTKQYRWRKRERWDSSRPADIIDPKFEVLHLYDGGVYDNLGMEPLFDIGGQVLKNNENDITIDFLVVSDAGAPLLRKTIPGPLHPGRLKRIADVGFDQARALRVRAFVNFLQKNATAGLYLQVGSNPIVCIQRYAKPEEMANLQGAYAWLTAEQVADAVAYKTTLRSMKESDFDLLTEHGYETALWNELLFFKNRKEDDRSLAQ